MKTALKQQVSSNREQARNLYEKRDITGLLSLLSQVTSESAILLHLEIALVHTSVIEASGTLSRTLLPYINNVDNFNFIPNDSHFIFGRFLSAMLLHHRDTNEPLGPGLIHFALVLNPLALKGMCLSPANQISFNKALTNFGLNQTISMIAATTPDKFLYPVVLDSLKHKTIESSTILAEIISKADVLSSPGKTLDEL
jgi:hypothetical protein